MTSASFQARLAARQQVPRLTVSRAASVRRPESLRKNGRFSSGHLKELDFATQGMDDSSTEIASGRWTRWGISPGLLPAAHFRRSDCDERILLWRGARNAKDRT